MYDNASGFYHLTPDTSGPTDGVRFELDAVDGSGRPIVPLAPIGWLDLSDHSSGGILTLQAHVQNGLLPNADFAISPSGKMDG